MSVSRADSCLRMPNISSCLRMVEAFSTSNSSAKETSSAGVLPLSSCSFISRIECPMEIGPANSIVASLAEKFAGLGAGQGRLAETPKPDALLAPVHWSRDATASAYVGWDDIKIRKDRTSGKGRSGFRLSKALLLERFHNRKND